MARKPLLLVRGQVLQQLWGGDRAGRDRGCSSVSASASPWQGQSGEMGIPQCVYGGPRLNRLMWSPSYSVMQGSPCAQQPHPSCPSVQPHFSPGHPPLPHPLCSNPSHPLKPLSSPNELTASPVLCSALPAGSCCYPPCPGSPVGTWGLQTSSALRGQTGRASPRARAGLAQALTNQTSRVRAQNTAPGVAKQGVKDGHPCREPQLPPREKQLAPGSTSGSMASALVSWQAQGCLVGTQTQGHHGTGAKDTRGTGASVPSHTRGNAPAHKPLCSKSL